jgi:S-phase kinase-associated protein 1
MALSVETIDGFTIALSPEEVQLSETLKTMIESTCDDDESIQVPITKATMDQMKKWLECELTCEKPYVNDKSLDNIRPWTLQLKSTSSWGPISEIIMAANYLNIENLQTDCCKYIAYQMKGKTPEEIREMFGLENDFTPEEEEEIKKEHQWALDL